MMNSALSPYRTSQAWQVLHQKKKPKTWQVMGSTEISLQFKALCIQSSCSNLTLSALSRHVGAGEKTGCKWVMEEYPLPVAHSTMSSRRALHSEDESPSSETASRLRKVSAVESGLQQQVMGLIQPSYSFSDASRSARKSWRWCLQCWTEITLGEQHP